MPCHSHSVRNLPARLIQFRLSYFDFFICRSKSIAECWSGNIFKASKYQRRPLVQPVFLVALCLISHRLCSWYFRSKPHPAQRAGGISRRREELEGVAWSFIGCSIRHMIRTSHKSSQSVVPAHAGAKCICHPKHIPRGSQNVMHPSNSFCDQLTTFVVIDRRVPQEVDQGIEVFEFVAA